MKRKSDNHSLTSKDHIWLGEEIVKLLEVWQEYYGSGLKAAKACGVCNSYWYSAKNGKTKVGPKICRGLGIKRMYQYTYDDNN